ncbi:PREDICTED: protein phosphatase Slingshot homolog 2-like [Amphimedon queenslandica]|uniref:protein-serine/threonine phosphatase n=1 Tax=Amphimedon queenslandica TaxID=400682 RepID=A0A1X7TYC0_AMPQE|nr:PREDICTED: protein phosphatase Slingshot homolog 2-like [Amphimedon queenslandica]|eukprot:XP_003389465.1 PREDICTED: protein phosphatase Slingshot homolog 2-like [Amphimedon queenslandica]
MSLQTLERSSPSPQESISESEDQGSLSSYEGFVCREGCAICLTPRPGASVGKHKGSLRIMNHLRKLNKLMRPQDAIRLGVELERCTVRPVTRYMVVISTQGVQDTEETIVLGTEQSADVIKICLVLPLWRNTEIKLDGDGGFSVHCQDKHHMLKPLSVQSMWTALQFLFKATEQARSYNYYDGGLSHTWMTFYQAQLTDDGIALNEWRLQGSLLSFRPDSPIYYDVKGLADWTQLDAEKRAFKDTLIQKLRDVMLHLDLDTASSRQIRQQLENEMMMNLKEYRGFLDQQMLYIVGQLEEPSKIHEYLYLGTEWNASNLLELKEMGVEYILNMTKEIDNFYPESFKYKTIRVYDLPESELLKHWDDTYKFIKEVKERKSKLLVHCKMGISRSAATVIAYTMKEYRMSLEDALSFVRSQRSCIKPNHGFMSQLKAYEGILKARYNDLFGTQAPSRITFQSRSSSDPNIRQRLFVNEEELEIQLADGERGQETPQDAHEHNEVEDEPPQMRPVSAGTHPPLNSTKTSPLQIPLVLESRVHQSLPPEKAEGMMNYLESLDTHHIEDERDLGINDPSSSESESPFSSPPFTPPDEDGMTFQRYTSTIKSMRKTETSHNSSDVLAASTLSPNDSVHSRVARATSLPSSLRPSSASERSYPSNQLSPSKRSLTSQEKLNEVGEEEVGGADMEVGGDKGEGKEQINPTLITSVTNRIKEIEKMNNRPSSAGKRSNLSRASSEESLPSCQSRDVHVHVSDVHETTPSPIQTEQPIVNESSNTTEVLAKEVVGGADISTCDSPNTRYQRATKAASMLGQKRSALSSPEANNPPTGGGAVNAISDEGAVPQEREGGEGSKGVRELLGVFDKQSSTKGGGGELKRTSSLRGSTDVVHLLSHKRGASIGDI